MPQKFVTTEAELIIPGAYGSFKVEKNNSGLATTGVIMLVGEADAGPDFSRESDLQSNRFTPDQLASVVAKYRTGNLVDAFRAATTPANDPDIVGAPSAVVLVKTNKSTKASATLARPGFANYGSIQDKSYGSLGNSLYLQVQASVPEVAPILQNIIVTPTSTGATLRWRVNGGAAANAALAAGATAFDTFIAAVNAVSGLVAYGATARSVLSAGLVTTGSIALVTSGNNITITLTLAGAWNGTPSAGDILVIPATGDLGAGGNSAIIGAASANRGSYVVTAATATTISATKIRDIATSALTPPVSVTVTDILATSDILCFSPISIEQVTGADRSVLVALQVSDASTLGFDATGQDAVLTISSAWNAIPRAGDLLNIPAGSAIAGGGSANVGWYRVTAATATTITVTRINNGAPVDVAPTDITAISNFTVLRPVINGTGKAIELFDGGGTDNVSTVLFSTLGANLASSLVSTQATPVIVASASEYEARLLVTRQSDGIEEEIKAGGIIALRIGYDGTTASMTVTGTALTTTVVGGLGANLSINLKDHATIADLVSFINAQTGYKAAVATTLSGQLPVTSLDEGTYNICGEFSASMPGRVKADAYKFYRALLGGSAAVTLDLEATAGLPEVQSIQYLTGGSKAGTLQADVIAAIDALEKVRGNFLVPLFSRDATSDITDALTESTSTYAIEAINAYAKTHVLKMGQVKRRKARLGVVSIRGTFAAAKAQANNLASAPLACTFQDFKNVASDGSIKQFHPWMGAVLAAGMQAAGFYRAIFNKGINCSGIIQAAGDFSDMDDGQVEDALNNGLLVARRPEEGGFKFVSDQTTYGKDSNFVYNSLQAMYAAQLITLTAAQRMERAFVGQSVADVSAAVALSFFEGIMKDFRSLKLIAPSDDAPKGYKDVTITLAGPALVVSAEIKLAGAIYFIPISFLVTQVTQTAAA